MNMIHVVPAVTEEASGPSYSVTRLCESLCRQGAVVTLAALGWTRDADYRPYLKTFPIGWGPRALGRSPKMNRWLHERVATGTIGIVHNHGMWQMNSLYPAWATRQGDAKYVVSPRGTLSKWAMKNGSRAKLAFWPILQRPALAHVACFHATSESEYDDIRRLRFRQPVAIVPNGVDIPGISNKADADADAVAREKTLLFLGRLHKVKGLDLLLNAWAQLETAFPEWRLVIAGTDSGFHASTGYLESLKGMVRELRLARVSFVGALYGAEKWDAYRRASLFVLPTYSENFAMTVAESLSVGTPAVVSRGAPWSGLANHHAGWWVDISVDGLLRALADGMSLPTSDLDAMGRRGREWMAREYSWDGVAAQMMDVYRWLDGNSSRAPDCVHIN
jgi:glycosyltransferase involved in cell wall biosynthesis